MGTLRRLVLCSLLCLTPLPVVRAADLAPCEHLYWLLPRPPGPDNVEAIRALLRDRAPGLPFEAYALPAGEEGQIADPAATIAAANSLEREFPGKLIFAAGTVGTEGWETSCHPRRANPDFRVSQEQWLQGLEALRVRRLALLLSHFAVPHPDPEAVAAYVARFARFCRRHDRECFVWLSAQMLPRGEEGLARAVVAAAGGDVDHYVWMDAPALVYVSGDYGLSELLGKLVSITPPEKTVLQFVPHPRHLNSPERATEYLAAAQQHGIRSAAVLGRVENLDLPGWSEFWRTLPRAR